MKKLTIALITAPILLAGVAAFAGMQHHGDDEKCDRGHGNGHEKRMDKSDREDRADRMLERMSKRLELSDEQQVAMKTLFADQKEQRQTMRSEMQSFHQAMRNLDPAAADYDTNLTEAKRIAADLAVNKVDQKISMKTELSKILTAEQLSKFEDMRERHGEGHGKKHGDKHGDKGNKVDSNKTQPTG